MPDAARFDDLTLPACLAGPGQEWVFDRAGMYALDRATSDEFGIPGLVLMENAATALAHLADAMLRRLNEHTALILAGPGNNGGDGFALARKLVNMGWGVSVALLAPVEAIRGDAAVNLTALSRMGIATAPMYEGDTTVALDDLWGRQNRRGLLVDAIFGIGLTTPPRSPFDAAAGWINRARTSSPERSAVLAVDIPSGLDAESGRPTGSDGTVVVRADVTLTLAGMKQGLLNKEAAVYTGRVMVGDIGAPRKLLARFTQVGEAPPPA